MKYLVAFLVAVGIIAFAPTFAWVAFNYPYPGDGRLISGFFIAAGTLYPAGLIAFESFISS